MKKQHLTLTETDHRYLTELLSKGQLTARLARRINGLILLNQGLTLRAVSEQLGVVEQTVGDWRNKYKKEGLEFLEDKQRSGRPKFFDGLVRAKITALACSETPTGYDKWSLRLLADKAVELKFCEGISYSKVRDILKKTNSSHI
jgi:transposase